MCGICGVVGLEPKGEAAAVLGLMLDAMVHRGPDDKGVFVAARAAIGMRRLSIIDIAGGMQPIWNETETLAVVFNGEIYNFRELRENLTGAGHRFRTASDTEVIVHAYEEWGEACIERFRGMFAFAVIELPDGPHGRASKIFLARDSLGIKPLYYSLAGGVLLFASELRSLLASGLIDARLSTDAIHVYLLFGSACEPVTMIEGIFSLPPGHVLSVSLDAPSRTLRLQPSRPYRTQIAPEGATAQIPAKAPASAAQATASPAKSVRRLLESAVKSHLVADVPVGIFLSSGLDSTALATLASRIQGGIQTINVAFPDLEFSEAELARRTAERLHTDHREICLSGHDMLARLDEAIAAFDQPSMDGINTYFVSWAAHEMGLKVALSGLGSDELFGGYPSFRDTSKIARVIRLAGLLPAPLRRVANGTFEARATIGPRADAFRKASAAWLDPTSLPHPYFFTRLLFTPHNILSGALTGSSSGSSLKGTPWYHWLAAAADEARTRDRFTAVSSLELRSYLVNTLLRDTDAMSMHHSLEVRVPFLDAPLVDYLLSLPESAKNFGTSGAPGHPKALLIAALADLLPPELISQTKRTFTFPWKKWLRGDLRDRIEAGLQDWSPSLQPHLPGDFSLAVWHDFLNGRTSWSRPWSLYVLNEWVKRNIPSASKGSVVYPNPASVSAA
jgi:asparagine synthase (glutamine-hydrolysing)